MLDKLIEQKFNVFGPNKRQEIGRLVFEIAKRERIKIELVLSGIPVNGRAYPAVKEYLLKRRFPEASGRKEKISESFSAVDIIPVNAMPLLRKDRVPVPARIHVEQGLEGCDLARRAREMFPLASVDTIKNYKDHCADTHFNASLYNCRTEDLFIIREAEDQLKPCPCSNGAVPCGYHNISLGFGCPFECSYCFLQNYANAPGIVLPGNIEEILDVFGQERRTIRVGSGQTTDSLVYDDLTGFSTRIVDFFRSRPNITFEFKTKSDNIGGLLSVKAAPNIVIGWSVNPQTIIDGEEHFTAGLAGRLNAARRCAAHGYRTAFHFDPIIYTQGWQDVYTEVVEQIFNLVPPESVAWISLGTLRMTAEQKKSIENRFPENTILDAELLTAEDGKLRYADRVRVDIYRRMSALLKEHRSPSTNLYLCMETPSVCRACGMNGRSF